MYWLVQLFQPPHGAAQSVLVLGLVIALGLGIGSIRVWGITLGVAGVLFAGLLFGHLRLTIDDHVLEFAREFGLILFVYTIGVQVGPGFIASLRREGLPLNLMAAATVMLGVIVTLGIHYGTRGHVDVPTAVGIFAGATTNTPSLAAAQQALKDIPGVSGDTIRTPGVAYAVSYPFGIVGIIVAMLVVRHLFRIDVGREIRDAMERVPGGERIAMVNLEVKNANLDGLKISEIPTLDDTGVVISRVKQNDRAVVAHPDTVLRLGDVVLAVGPPAALDKLRLIIGQESAVDVAAIPSNITSRRLLVTKTGPLGKSVHELNLRRRFGVTVTRLNRAEIDLPITPDLRLHFGDNLVVVGEDQAIQQVAREMGDSPTRLTHPQIIPMFVGIALGVIVGSWPLHIPGVPAPVKLGLAGGPLLVAILLSRLGNFGPLVWYLPISANFIVREVGIALFLACVGLRAGDQFVATLMTGSGFVWMGYGALITVVPLLIVAIIARAVYRVNFLTICGLLAGSMTDPPALAFAGSITGSELPHVSYAAVYPLVMILRVVAAQAMILFFYRF